MMYPIFRTKISHCNSQEMTLLSRYLKDRKIESKLHTNEQIHFILSNIIVTRGRRMMGQTYLLLTKESAKLKEVAQYPRQYNIVLYCIVLYTTFGIFLCVKFGLLFPRKERVANNSSATHSYFLSFPVYNYV